MVSYSVTTAICTILALSLSGSAVADPRKGFSMRKLFIFSFPTNPGASLFQPPEVSLAVGFGAGAGGAFAFTTPDGRCNTQSFTTAQGATSAFGPGTANVNGAVDTEAGCADDAKPGDFGASIFSGFVSTGSVGIGDECFSNTEGAGNSQSFGNGGGAFSGIRGALGGSSSCGGRK